MNSRFSLQSLMCGIAYAGLGLAGVTYPLSIWPSVNFYAWIAIVVWLGTKATAFPSPRGAFAIGALAATFSYVIADSFEYDPLDASIGAPFAYSLPHHALIELIVPEAQTTGVAFGVGLVNPAGSAARLTLHRWSVTNFSLAFGLLGGCLALWRYRCLEHRAKREKVE